MASVFSNRRSKKSPDIACIFVHAGAGYHSIQNEHIHLQACTDAARAGMQIMRNGGSAADAVEIAIKIMEDREITNAAYGSNLAMDGVVECDAVIVDQYGRSGGCGAVAQIKNPICLARLVLDASTQQLSLRRVPPNLLVGQGAVDFAASFGMPVLPHDALISPAARERWLKWKLDLKTAEARARHNRPHMYANTSTEAMYDVHAEDQIREQMRRAHTLALEAGVWNDAQPLSPPSSSDRLSTIGSSMAASPSNVSRRSTPSALGTSSANSTPESTLDLNPSPYTSTDPNGPPSFTVPRTPFINPMNTMNTPDHLHNSCTLVNNGRQIPHDGHNSSHFQAHFAAVMSPEYEMTDLGPEPSMSDLHRSRYSSWNDGSSEDDQSASSSSTLQLPSLTPSPEPQHPTQYEQHPQRSQRSDFSPSLEAINTRLPDTPAEKKRENPSPNGTTPLNHLHDKQHPPLPPSPRPAGPRKEDHITDTVGAIAIDSFGNIACGASSGGIGMKHRGRIGPAALVGVGAAVIPPDLDDKTKTTVGAVTSGTGEHMATTMAATVAAERLYHGVKKAKGGGFEDTDDDDALKSVVEKDFMGHPSVKHSNSAGAIGVLVVKKTKDGAYLYFAHNTDSFALASMHANEAKPVCTMSRSQGNGAIAQGGRVVSMRSSSSSSAGRRERHR